MIKEEIPPNVPAYIDDGRESRQGSLGVPGSRESRGMSGGVWESLGVQGSLGVAGSPGRGVWESLGVQGNLATQ